MLDEIQIQKIGKRARAPVEHVDSQMNIKIKLSFQYHLYTCIDKYIDSIVRFELFCNLRHYRDKCSEKQNAI